MRVFLAGATGAIGRQLVPLLLAAGHEVTGTTRSPSRAEALLAAGAEAAILDALDADALDAAVRRARPDAVIHQLTALPPRIDPRRIERDFAATNRLREEATPVLVQTAHAVGARVIAQSAASLYAPGPPGTVHVEDDPLIDPQDAPKPFQRTAQAVGEHERHVLAADGIVLRYGYLYGPGSTISVEGALAREVSRRRLPLVEDGAGVWSFVHVHDAAGAALAALAHTGPAVYNIVDDEPAATAQWLPALAAALDAPAPLRIPALAARIAAGSHSVETMTRAQGAANARARRELEWKPRYPSWRKGFASAVA
jgi:nucleoside-diphosphate-sugar epimerase